MNRATITLPFLGDSYDVRPCDLDPLARLEMAQCEAKLHMFDRTSACDIYKFTRNLSSSYPYAGPVDDDLVPNRDEHPESL
jgi:hypothetical protein